MRTLECTLDRSPNGEDQTVLIWTELQVPNDLELTDQWAGYFQPLLRAPGHEGSMWGRVQERPNTILLLTGWKSTSIMKEFIASPSAKIYWENLKNGGIIYMSSRETFSRYDFWSRISRNFLYSYVQLFWVYFPAPVNEAYKARIRKLRSTENGLAQQHRPLKIWATNTEFVHGQEARLMVWSNFWQDESCAEYRHHREYNTIQGMGARVRVVHCKPQLERVSDSLEEVGAVGWKEEFVYFKQFESPAVLV
ncbi:Dimeric alpha-beta barrel [Penicillium vulpinum]|uniref:ABM domain-containing protein n=1 Tax=Penicillium vulpinum TaxID=29845 RepID=A0A1V6RMX0_9EURO|nr:Dimeric alpha-beta barrel [Penicillium vulpinum]KAJ5964745.1 Dimeric alpha-beta barrel [Penicillium vulpinum]OQE02774.1 hypothetical protein PENVUL_c038G03673 [Penicillium vulpinum]